MWRRIMPGLMPLLVMSCADPVSPDLAAAALVSNGHLIVVPAGPIAIGNR